MLSDTVLDALKKLNHLLTRKQAKVHAYVGETAIVGRVNLIVRKQNLEGSPADKYLIAGSMLTAGGVYTMPTPENWPRSEVEMIECDIIIIPRKIHRGINSEGMTISDLLIEALDPEVYAEHHDVGVFTMFDL